MGLLVDGIWTDDSPDRAQTPTGRFRRPTTKFRNWITFDGSPGPSGEGGFVAEPDRYHLYVSLACPWAHRTIIFRHLKRLEQLISMSTVSWHMGETGWTFDTEEGSSGDPVNNARRLSEIYVLSEPKHTGRVTVPVLWDKKRKRIVSNESSEIIRMFNSSFANLTNEQTDYCPADLREALEAVNELVYQYINNGVYRAGFATAQEAYEEACRGLFGALDELEQRLSLNRFLLGDRMTEADWRLFPTLVRFDVVYYSHFKCNLRRIADYPNLSNYMRDLYQLPGVDATVNFDHIKKHYYGSQRRVNPTGIWPLGPAVGYHHSHDRNRFKRSPAEGL
ncbi:glutathione S-transferase family protein [Bradyrhizobium mercantei]|uniref:glutathione S-transferase family protein n=1 Tax=Bradyrhizobium mercantei TaxID=1904807 RepID=UPI00097773BE|nr:glutathione S-transferase family protein [Bradyrhizobium mercantei]